MRAPRRDPRPQYAPVIQEIKKRASAMRVLAPALTFRESLDQAARDAGFTDYRAAMRQHPPTPREAAAAQLRDCQRVLDAPSDSVIDWP